MRTRITGANFGASDIIEVFSIANQANTSSLEASRILIDFPISASIITDRNNNLIPQSGSVNFFLRLYNAPHGETLPRNFTLMVTPVSRSWEEGNGLDLEEGTDITRNGVGTNWINAASGTQWTSQGGDYLTSSYLVSQSFSQGFEDLEIDISSLVERWISNNIARNGLAVFLTSSQESGSTSNYTKKFFSRTSEHFFKRPIIEARWDSSVRDHRGKFYVSSSLLSSGDNTYTVYLYNYVTGTLKNIPTIGTGNIYLQVYTSASGPNGGALVSTTPSVVTGGYHTTGTYSASFSINSTGSVYYDIWYSGASTYHTGVITASAFGGNDNIFESKKYISSLTNLKSVYNTNEKHKIRLFNRLKNWNPNIYTVASNVVKSNIVDNAYFKVLRIPDNNIIIDYGTGSLNHTRLSYDSLGNYFDFDFSILEPNYSYGFKFVFNINGNYEEQPYTFKFNVKDT